MAIMRAIGAVLAGALTAFVLGAVYEYLPPAVSPDPAKWQYLYPWLLGGTGLISSVVAMLVFYPAVTLASTKAALRGAGSQPARQGSSAKPALSKKPEDVPGMPKFDFDAAKREIAEGSGAGASSPPATASSLPSAPLSAAPGSGVGSRPAGSSTAPQEGDKH